MKPIATIAAAAALTVLTAAPGHAAVTGYGVATATPGTTKHDVQSSLGSKGSRARTWSDRGAWLQKTYRGVKLHDQWQGTETKAVLDYRWTPGVGWVLESKAWCVWDNLNTWVCR